MARFAAVIAVVGVAAILVTCVEGHGMLIDPPNRASAWRYGFNTPTNYNDNELFCGGQNVMHQANGGRCGLCGDNWQDAQPRAHENGGKYGTGTIVAGYQTGNVIKVTARLTTNHKGYFNFDLCPLQNPSQLETEECFAKYPLEIASGGTKYVLPNNEKGEFQVELVLPAGVACEQCVLRWTYTAGNTWGDCGNGSWAAGCGPQETFKNCADITIS